MENDIILKRAFIGGFNRHEVMDCINALQTKVNKTKSELAQLDALRAKVDKLEAEIEQKETEICELSKYVDSVKGSVKIKEVSNSLIHESMVYADRYVESVKIIAQDISEKTSEQVENAKIRIEVLMDWLGGISDSVLDLYASLSDLKQEYDSFKIGYGACADKDKNFAEEKKSDCLEPEKSDPVQVKDGFTDPASQQCAVSSIPDDDMIDLMRKTEAQYREMIG